MRQNAPSLDDHWVPLVQVLERLTSRLGADATWSASTYSASVDFDPYRSPFAQAKRQADGSLVVEVSSRTALSAEQLASLINDGWNSPGVDNPNPHRSLSAGWNAHTVAESVVAAFVETLGLAPGDFVNFGDDDAQWVAGLALLARVDDGPIFSIEGAASAAPPTQTAANFEPLQSDEYERLAVLTDLPLVECTALAMGLAGAVGRQLVGWTAAERDTYRATWKSPIGLHTMLVLLESRSDTPLVRQLGELQRVFATHTPLTVAGGDVVITLDGRGGRAPAPAEEALLSSSEPLLRALVAISEIDAARLAVLSWDECVMVRWSVATNPLTPVEVLEVLRDDDSWEVAAAAIAAIGPADSATQHPRDESRRVWPRACPCTTGLESLHEMFDIYSLELPLLPEHLRNRIAWQGERFWATQPRPLAMDDYLMNSAQYLHGAVADQVAISNAGHGINSFGLTLRLAVGPLTLLVQCLWGGLLSRSAESWNLRMDEVNELLALIDTRRGPQHFAERRLHVRFSDFRDNTWVLDVRTNGGWQAHEFATFDELRRRFISELARVE